MSRLRCGEKALTSVFKSAQAGEGMSLLLRYLENEQADLLLVLVLSNLGEARDACRDRVLSSDAINNDTNATFLFCRNYDPGEYGTQIELEIPSPTVRSVCRQAIVGGVVVLLVRLVETFHVFLYMPVILHSHCSCHLLVLAVVNNSCQQSGRRFLCPRKLH